MAPPRPICSAYAEYLAIKQQLQQTIADIKSALSKALKIKYSILYGLISIADAASASVASAANAAAATISQAVLAQASALASTAIEAALAPLLKILLSGPEAVFGLVGLPLKKAIEATDKEAYFLNKAKYNLDIVISIFSKWTNEFGGGKYAQKMRDALPFIESAINQCSSVISKLDGNSQFDELAFNSMRSNINAAIEITTADSVILNRERLDMNIQERARISAEPKIEAIKAKYRKDKEAVTKAFIQSKRTKADSSTFAVILSGLESKKKIDIESVKLRAVKDATLDKSTYAGIINNPAAEFSNDMSILGSALLNFGKYIALAYTQYKASQAYTASTYNIELLINELIKSMIELVGKMGDGAGKAVQSSLRFTNEILIKVSDIYTETLARFNSTNETISSTGMSVKLSVGHEMLVAADSTISGTITDSMIELINADEALAIEKKKMERLFESIQYIPDWGGKLSVWGVNPLLADVAPYPRLMTSTTAMIGTLLSVGIVPNPEAISANSSRISETSKIFRQISRHNSYVSGALKSYYPPTSPYVEEFRRAVPAWLMSSFLAGATAFNCIFLARSLGGDKVGGALKAISPLASCKIAYKDLFPKSVAKAQAVEDSLSNPVQFNSVAAGKMEAADLDRAEDIDTLQTMAIVTSEADDLVGSGG